MIFNLNPSAEANLALGDLDAFLLADRVLATSTVVGGNLCIQKLARRVRRREGQQNTLTNSVRRHCDGMRMERVQLCQEK